MRFLVLTTDQSWSSINQFMQERQFCCERLLTVERVLDREFQWNNVVAILVDKSCYKLSIACLNILRKYNVSVISISTQEGLDYLALFRKLLFIQQNVDPVQLCRPPDLMEMRTLQFERIAQESLQWLGQVFKIKKVHWFEFSSLKDFIESPQELVDLRLTHRLNEVELQTTSKTATQFLINWLRDLPKQYLMSSKIEHFIHRGEVVVFCPIKEAGECLGYVGFQFDSQPMPEAELIECEISKVEPLFSLALQMHKAKQLSFMDDLTVLYNQRYLPELLDREISRCRRENASFTVLFMDVDYFKKVNDKNGHLVGSRILKEIGEMIFSSIRICDSGFRYGGDEFVIVLADTNIETAEIVAERIRKKVEKTVFCPDTAKVKVTVSIGLACFPQHAKTREEIVLMADQAMYDGKAKSRNIVFKAS